MKTSYIVHFKIIDDDFSFDVPWGVFADDSDTAKEIALRDVRDSFPEANTITFVSYEMEDSHEA